MTMTITMLMMVMIDFFPLPLEKLMNFYGKIFWFIEGFRSSSMGLDDECVVGIGK